MLLFSRSRTSGSCSGVCELERVGLLKESCVSCENDYTKPLCTQTWCQRSCGVSVATLRDEFLVKCPCSNWRDIDQHRIQRDIDQPVGVNVLCVEPWHRSICLLWPGCLLGLQTWGPAGACSPGLLHDAVACPDWSVFLFCWCPWFVLIIFGMCGLVVVPSAA